MWAHAYAYVWPYAINPDTSTALQTALTSRCCCINKKDRTFRRQALRGERERMPADPGRRTAESELRHAMERATCWLGERCEDHRYAPSTSPEKVSRITAAASMLLLCVLSLHLGAKAANTACQRSHSFFILRCFRSKGNSDFALSFIFSF